MAEIGPDAVAVSKIRHTGSMRQSTSTPVPKPPPSGYRALVVDDERALAELVGSYLDRDGFEVSLAYDGRQAIERAQQVDPDSMVFPDRRCRGLPGRADVLGLLHRDAHRAHRGD